MLVAPTLECGCHNQKLASGKYYASTLTYGSMEQLVGIVPYQPHLATRPAVFLMTSRTQV